MRKKGVRREQVVKQFAQRVRDARQRIGMSQYQLAQKAQVSHGYLARLERGETGPGLDVITRLADALGTSTQDLIADSNQPADAFDVAYEHLKVALESIVERRDLPAVQSLALFCTALDQMLARRNK